VTLVVEEDATSTQHSTATDAVLEKTKFNGFETDSISQEKFGECVATDVIKKTNSPESNPITVDEYKEYVAGLHVLNNKAFEIQFKVQYYVTQIPCMICLMYST
jgi:hypothetical protein